MIIAPVTTRQLPTTSATILAEDKRLFLHAEGERFPLARRACANVASLTGLTPKRMTEMAGAGGICLADQLRGSFTTTLALGVQGDAVVAVSGRTPSVIDSEEIIGYLAQEGFTLRGRTIVDGRCLATKLTSKALLIGADIYHAGISLEIDLAGHQLPSTNHYVERQICVNGQAIALMRNDRLVPQYGDDGAVNADRVTRHLAAWSNQGLSEHIVNRLQVATETPASFAEALTLHSLAHAPDIVGLRKTLSSSRGHSETYADSAFDQILGDFRTRFGVASINEIPKRELQLLPTETSVAGLINLATEMSTYHVPRDGGNSRLAHWWNRLMGRPYHLESLEKKAIPLPARWMSPGHMASVN